MRDELKNIEISLFLYNIDDYKAKIEEIKNGLGIIEAQKIKEEEKSNNLQNRKRWVKKIFRRTNWAYWKNSKFGLWIRKKERTNK